MSSIFLKICIPLVIVYSLSGCHLLHEHRAGAEKQSAAEQYNIEIGGEVRFPGQFSVNASRIPLDRLMSLSGGLQKNDNGNDHFLAIRKHDSADTTTYLSESLLSSDLSRQIEIHHDDFVRVTPASRTALANPARSTQGMITVSGMVQQPGAYDIKTVGSLEELIDITGANKYVSQSGLAYNVIVISRPGNGSRIDKYILDRSSIKLSQSDLPNGQTRSSPDNRRTVPRPTASVATQQEVAELRLYGTLPDELDLDAIFDPRPGPNNPFGTEPITVGEALEILRKNRAGTNGESKQGMARDLSDDTVDMGSASGYTISGNLSLAPGDQIIFTRLQLTQLYLESVIGSNARIRASEVLAGERSRYRDCCSQRDTALGRFANNGALPSGDVISAGPLSRGISRVALRLHESWQNVSIPLIAP